MPGGRHLAAVTDQDLCDIYNKYLGLESRWRNSLAASGEVDLDAVETFWIARVHEFFSAKPFKIRLDASRSLRTLGSVRKVLP